jgi:hypothetical protein
MGSFSGTIAQVANTRIFARPSHNGTQFIVYQMNYATENDLALILPLPTPPNTAEDAVRFIDLSGYPDFFIDIEAGFPYTRSAATPNPRKSQPLKNAGNYDATFIASPQGFERLEEPFRMPESVWQELFEYNDFGFAVFKLRADANVVHPLAFEFPVRNPNLLYFPTVHVHDGTVPGEANFDHDLFCQARAGWLRSYDVAGSFMDMDRAQGVLDANERVSRMTVQGMHPNSDIIVGLKA